MFNVKTKKGTDEIVFANKVSNVLNWHHPASPLVGLIGNASQYFPIGLLEFANTTLYVHLSDVGVINLLLFILENNSYLGFSRSSLNNFLSKKPNPNKIKMAKRAPKIAKK